MASPQDHRLYPIILKQVLWDEAEEKIRKRLTVNEVPDDEAEAILSAARKERIHILRSHSREQLLRGLIAFLVGAAVVGGFWWRMKAFHIGVLAGSGVFLVAGFILILIGTLGHLNAPNKKGPIATGD